MLKHFSGNTTNIKGLTEELDSLSTLCRNNFSDSIDLTDSRNLPRDYQLSEKINQLVADNWIPESMRTQIGSHEKSIIRTLQALERTNTEFSVRDRSNEEICEQNDLYITAIEHTLNRGNHLDDISCCSILPNGRLDWTPWYAHDNNLSTLPRNHSESQYYPYIVIEWSESNDFKTGETLSLKEAEDKFARLDFERKESRELGYDKVKFHLCLLDSCNYEGRYDLGDGEGGLINHIEHFWSETYEWEFNVGDISKEEYEAKMKETKQLVSDLRDSYDMQESIYEFNVADNLLKSLKELPKDELSEDITKEIESHMENSKNCLNRITQRNTDFNAGIDTKDNSGTIVKNPIKASVRQNNAVKIEQEQEQS